jgi:hypothetical protein
MAGDTLSQLRDLGRHLNHVARSVIETDGEHAAMFFLRVEGGDVAQLFSEAGERPVGEARGREVAEAVRSTGADAVVCVSEAWSAAAEAVQRAVAQAMLLRRAMCCWSQPLIDTETASPSRRRSVGCRTARSNSATARSMTATTASASSIR